MPSYHITIGETNMFEMMLGKLFIPPKVAKFWEKMPPSTILAVREPMMCSMGQYVYIFGGFGPTMSNELWRLDTLTSSYVKLASGPSARYKGCMVAVGTNLHVLGGSVNSAPTNEHRIYNTLTGVWSTGAVLPTARDSQSAITVDGKIYMFGGNINPVNLASVYDPALNQWKALANMTAARNRGMVCQLADKNIIYYIMGEYNYNNDKAADGQMYDIAANKWTFMSGIPFASSVGNAGLGTIDNIAYLYYGVDGTVNTFDGTTWGVMPLGTPRPVFPRGNFAMTSCGESFFFSGGYAPGLSYTNEIWRCTPNASVV